jgi:hypothetical protein
MRFRRLTTEELLSLETEFKQFLIIHELYDEEWRKLAQEEPDRAEKFIELFSDVVFEKIFNELSYLVHFSDNLVSFFDVRFDPLKAFHIQSPSGISLENEGALKEAFIQYSDKLSFYKGQKNNIKNKAEEVWALIQKGSQKCDETYFNHYAQAFDLK